MSRLKRLELVYEMACREFETPKLMTVDALRKSVRNIWKVVVDSSFSLVEYCVSFTEDEKALNESVAKLNNILETFSGDMSEGSFDRASSLWAHAESRYKRMLLELDKKKIGIFPLHQDHIPDHFFNISDEMNSSLTSALNFSQSSFSCEQEPTTETSKGIPTKLLHVISPVLTIEKGCGKGNKHTTKLITSMRKIKCSPAIKAYPNNQDRVEDSCNERDNNCIECDKYYYQTGEELHWIKCLNCAKWMHESYTMYGNLCNIITEKKEEEIIYTTILSPRMIGYATVFVNSTYRFVCPVVGVISTPEHKGNAASARLISSRMLRTRLRQKIDDNLWWSFDYIENKSDRIGVVIVKQNLPMVSKPEFTPLPSLSKTQYKDGRICYESSLAKENNVDARRVSQVLVDELLLDIYHRQKCMSVSGYTSTTSVKSQRSVTEYSTDALEEKAPLVTVVEAGGPGLGKFKEDRLV
ncbi:hypothetical protein FQA39_LY05819 [Lamprigera yunnana]|nr:hypothetical protein FQA39_LY05819 [Lamprigera yunnana]